MLSARIYSEAVIRLTADEWRILSLLDGHRKVGDLVEISGCSRFGVFQVLYSMLTAGFVEQVYLSSTDRLYNDTEVSSASSSNSKPRKRGLLSFFRS
jgi:hypothetical protein